MRHYERLVLSIVIVIQLGICWLVLFPYQFTPNSIRSRGHSLYAGYVVNFYSENSRHNIHLSRNSEVRYSNSVSAHAFGGLTLS